MSIPLDRLYHYLADCVNHDLLIYRWLPHGSRKLEDLAHLTTYSEFQWYNSPIAIFHDQEPLYYNFYSQDQIYNQAKKLFQSQWSGMLKDSVLNYVSQQHIRGATGLSVNTYDMTILVHSEQNSSETALYQQAGFVSVYYWSHAIIALDWFRYAQHDPTLTFDLAKTQQDFLIYQRAWSGTREYRLCFVEQLLEHNLEQHCNIGFNPEDGKHYTAHQFVNTKFQINNHNLHHNLRLNTHNPTASADYCGQDYAASCIEIVLETLFDDTRWHLTEKTLRPIACGKPFILAATPGSLQYLKNYGFETFSGLIDESYDTIADSRARIDAIIQEMKRIAALDADAKQTLYTQLHEIAQRNKQRFFNGLFDQVIAEYKTNMDRAMAIMNQHCTGRHRAAIRQLLQQN